MSAVRVEEVRALTYSSAATVQWWTLFRHHGPAERFTIVRPGFPGDLVDVACDDQEHAEWLYAFLLEQGLPKSALKVIR